MQEAIPIHDNHFHCRPDGWKGIDAAKEFAAAGGTSIAHVRLPSYVNTVEAFEETCRVHIAFGNTIAKEVGIAVYPAVGPYPLEIMKVAEANGWDEADAFARGCYDVAAGFCEEKEAVCVGEIGRAHFEVEAEVQDHLSRLMVYGMGKAKDAGVPVMLHTEHTEPDTMAEFGAMADKAGLPRDRVIKHYCGPLVREEEHHGIFPSIIAGRSNIRKALQKRSDRFMLETDYIDEPTRPDVVMPPTTVPKRITGFLQNGDIPEEVAYKIGRDWPERLYG